MTKPQVGHYLYATCAGEDYGQVIAVGKDENDTPTIDIEVYAPDDLLSYDDDWLNPPLTRIELPPNTKVILRNVQWKSGTRDGWIECNTPGNNCYRCTKSFMLNTERTRF